MTVSDGLGWLVLGWLIGFLWNRERQFAMWVAALAAFSFFVKYCA